MPMPGNTSTKVLGMFKSLEISLLTKIILNYFQFPMRMNESLAPLEGEIHSDECTPEMTQRDPSTPQTVIIF